MKTHYRIIRRQPEGEWTVKDKLTESQVRQAILNVEVPESEQQDSKQAFVQAYTIERNLNGKRTPRVQQEWKVSDWMKQITDITAEAKHTFLYAIHLLKQAHDVDAWDVLDAYRRQARNAELLAERRQRAAIKPSPGISRLIGQSTSNLQKAEKLIEDLGGIV